jgi:ketosteroid isomerase-like protein
MNRYASITSVARALLLTGVIMLACNAKSYAQTDIAAVKAAISSFHVALGALDIAKMEPLWAHNATVMLINPRDKSVTIGWDDVKKNWETVFNFWSELTVTQAAGPYVRVDGDVAWSTGVANVKGKPKTGSPVNAPTFETDIFQKQGGEWQLVSHTASRISQ